MASSVLNQVIGTLHSFGSSEKSRDHRELGKVSVRLPFKVQRFQVIGLKQDNQRSASSIRASASQTSVFDPVSTPSNSKSTSSESRKKSNEAALILIRH
ncbi:hypothetical protein CRG98_005752, partial [Punica granatum]